jgi:hypothetical protein
LINVAASVAGTFVANIAVTWPILFAASTGMMRNTSLKTLRCDRSDSRLGKCVCEGHACHHGYHEHQSFAVQVGQG